MVVRLVKAIPEKRCIEVLSTLLLNHTTHEVLILFVTGMYFYQHKKNLKVPNPILLYMFSFLSGIALT